MSDYDYIVIGCGGIGSAAVYWLARRAGKRVLGLEQYNLGHEHGGSQDNSRIIRLAYHDIKYNRLTRPAYDAFAEVERESGLKLVHKTGGLDFAARGSQGEIVLNHVAKAMDEGGIHYEDLSPSELRRRFPQFHGDDKLMALYQPEGGLVDAALANSVHQQLAVAHGATILEHAGVSRVEATEDGGVKVYTSKGTFTGQKLIVTAGAWINHVLGSVGVHIPLRVTQEQVTYFATPNVKQFTKDNFPIFIYRLFDGKLDYYGLPTHVNSGLKVAIDASGPLVTPETRTYTPDRVREEKVDKFMAKFLPEGVGRKMYTKTCLYAMTLDRDFVIDTLKAKRLPQIIVCNGAGHAYKFCSILGKILSQIAVDGHSQHDITGFSLDRPAINNPNYGGGTSSTDWNTYTNQTDPSKL